MFAPPQASPALALAFVVIAIVIAVVFIWMRWSAAQRLGETRAAAMRATAIAAALATAWLALTWSVAQAGLLARFELRPPPFLLLVVVIVAASSALAFGPIGTALVRGVPLWGLVLAQSFRLPLELAMHQAVVEGVMPNQMSYSGANFDIVTGTTAIVVAWLLATGRAGRRLAAAWNVMGALLLINIVTVAILSTPVVGAFGPDRLNTFVAYPPFVWLPTVMVSAAIAGHLVVWRALRG